MKFTQVLPFTEIHPETHPEIHTETHQEVRTDSLRNSAPQIRHPSHTRLLFGFYSYFGCVLFVSFGAVAHKTMRPIKQLAGAEEHVVIIAAHFFGPMNFSRRLCEKSS